MSSLAVFLVLGGATAFAATKIGSKEIKANAITTGKIKKEAVTTSKIKNNAVATSKIANDAVTGAKVDEATLGTVPSATNATNAVNASTVGGVRVIPLSIFQATGSVPAREILNLNGLVLRANCGAGIEEVVASTTVAGGEISSVAVDANTKEIPFGVSSDNFGPGDNVVVTNTSSPNNDLVTISYLGGDGRVVTVELSTEGPNASQCHLGGHAIG